MSRKRLRSGAGEFIRIASDVLDFGPAPKNVPRLWEWCNARRDGLQQLLARLGEAGLSVAVDEFRSIPEIVKRCRNYLLGLGATDIPDRFGFPGLPLDQTPGGPKHFPDPTEGFVVYASTPRTRPAVMELIRQVEDFLTWAMAWCKESEKPPVSQVGQQQAPESGKTRKRSTEKGEARSKIVAALTEHHRYANGSCMNQEPIGVGELKRKSHVGSKSSVSRFFKQNFKGHGKYKAVCRDRTSLITALKMLNDEFSPHMLYGRTPPGERDNRDDADE
jgi:hypothetical protein